MLGEDRLRVELDAAVVRPDDRWMSPDSGSASTGRRPAALVAGPGRRTCCRSRPARSGRRSRPATGCPGRRCPCRRAGSRARGTASGGPGRPRGTAARRPAALATASRIGAILGSSPSRGSPGPGPTITRSKPSSIPGAYSSCRTTSLVMPSTPRTWRSMFTKSSSPSRITTALAREPRVRGRAALVGEPEPAEPRLRASRASSTSSSRTSSAMFVLGVGAGGTRPKALRMPPAFACVSATSYAASESRTRVAPAVTVEPAVEVDVGGADHDRAVDDRAARRRPGRGAPARRRSSRGPRARTRLISRQAFSTGLPVTVAAYIVSRRTSRGSRWCGRRGGTRCGRGGSSA